MSIFVTGHRIGQTERKENQFPKLQLKETRKEAQKKFKLGDLLRKCSWSHKLNYILVNKGDIMYWE